MNVYKPYLFPLLLFVVSHGLGVVLFKALEPYLIHDALRLVMRIVLSVLFFFFLVKYVQSKTGLFRFGSITKSQVSITLLLCFLFAGNNYLLANYAIKASFMENEFFSIVLVQFVVNSFYEEFTYRGFIQGYVNQHVGTKFPLSKGNLFASALMLLTHTGFFVVMDLFFAITGLILVVIFSLLAGYMRDRGASIWFLIVLHTLVNAIHILINLKHYV